MVMFPQIFFPIFSKNIAFFEKIVLWKNIQNLISHKKKVIFIFVARRLLSFKRDLGPRNGFLAFSQKITPFFENTAK